jgi:cytochrome c-type biogenesis protein CcmF
VALEFQRGTRVRMHQQGEPVLLALSRLVWRNKRRYGGYVVHVGVVLVFIGIAGSAAYQQESVFQMQPGELVALDDYLMRYEGHRLVAEDDHVAAVTSVSVLDRRSGALLASLAPEQRFHLNLQYPELREAFEKTRELGRTGSDSYPAAVAATYRLIGLLERSAGREVKTPSTEVAIHSSLSPLAPSRMGEDFYVTPLAVDPATGQASFRVFLNPMVNFIWLGGLVFVLGAQITVLPDSRERRRLEGAMALEERAVA